MRHCALPELLAPSAVELHTSFVADPAAAGFFVSAKTASESAQAGRRRESVSRKARACPQTGVNSRRSCGLTAVRLAFLNAFVEACMTRAPRTIPTVDLHSHGRLERPEPGAYLVRIHPDGRTEIERLPDSALLLDGGVWSRFWDAFKDLQPLSVRRA